MSECCKETYMTVRDLAGYLCLSEPTIRRYVLNQEIPFLKIMGAIRFRMTEIELWVESRKQKKTILSENVSEGKTDKVGDV